MLATLTLWAGVASAKLDPLRPLTRQFLRPEILIGLDTSGSMAWRGQDDSSVGADCSGTDTTDLCGDGLCSGQETTSSCAADCNISDNSTSTPGSAPQCEASTSAVSRMWMTKRSLRNALPELRTLGSFGLLTFQQTGYYPYYPTITGTARMVTIFLSEWELRAAGSWTGGAAWDGVARRPLAGFVRNGTAYRLLSDPLAQAATNITRSEDSLYRADGVSGYDYARFPWSVAGKQYNDGTRTWTYLGSYYSYLQLPIPTITRTTIDRRGRIRTTTTMPNPTVVGSYMGPQYTSGGTTWLYHRFDASRSGSMISGSSSAAMVVVPLTESETQTSQDGQLGQILNRLNYAANGGVFADGRTPLGETVQAAAAHYQQRQAGTGSFTAADPAAGCRQRYLLLLTDGEWNGSASPVDAARALYAQGGSNPIRTFVVGLPGLPATAIAELNRIADAGDDGVLNNSTRALLSTNEKDLVDNIKAALYAALKGEYTTAAAGTATVDTGGIAIANNVALVASAELPGWKGHLRAIDTAPATPVELWDAGTLLAARSWQSRRLLSGYPSTLGANMPLPLFDGGGNVNVRGQSGIPKGVVDIWPGTPPSDAEITAMIQWLAGKDRTWKLDSFVRSVPATVGPPPSLPSAGDHANFETVQAGRQTLIYAASTSGLLHAFDAKTGAELFAYLPPHLLPKVYALYKEGGQSDDPAEFSWVLASSPRVNDVRASDGTWSTQLVLTDGAGGDNFVVLDVTSPSTCVGTPAVCTANPIPMRVISHSAAMSPSVDGLLGQTWSLPSIYFSYTGSNPSSEAAMSSGYDMNIANEGSYYNRFSGLSPAWNPSASLLHSYRADSTGARVPFGLVADVAAAVDEDRGLDAVATYQATLGGQLIRFDKGQTGTGKVRALINAGTGHPFYYGPSVLHRGHGEVTFAIASGSYETDDALMADPAFVSTLMMRRESAGDVNASVENITCRVDEVCNCPGVEAPASCTAPSRRALPITRSFLVDNSATGLVEAFFLYWEPPTQVCAGNLLAQGDSYLVRIGTNGTQHRLMQVNHFPNTLASGMTIMGGTTGFVLTLSGRGTQTSRVEKVSGGRAAAAIPGEAVVESWAEVP